MPVRVIKPVSIDKAIAVVMSFFIPNPSCTFYFLSYRTLKLSGGEKLPR